MLTATFTHPDGTETVFELPGGSSPAANTLLTARIRRSLDRVARAELQISRPDWVAALSDIDRRSDIVSIARGGGTEFKGRIKDWKFNGPGVSIQIDSLERGALDGPSVYLDQTSDDSTHASFLIDAMPDPLTAGTIEQTRSDMKFSAIQIPIGEALRKLASQTRADVVYNTDGTVDYLKRRGDETDVVVDETTVTEPPEIRSDIREDTTDVTVFNPDDRPDVRYTESVVSEGRSVYRIEETEATTAAGREAAAKAIAEEIAEEPRYIEIAAKTDPGAFSTVVGIGDSLQVSLSKFDVDKRMVVVELERSFEPGGEQVQLLLSTRRETRDAGAL